MENTGLKGLAITLYQRVFKSYKSTLVGIACVALGYVVEYAVQQLTGSTNPLIHQAGEVVGGIWILVKDKLPKPSAVPAVLTALFLGFFAFGAQAQEEPVYGGCLKGGATCIGPSVGVSLLSIDLKKGTTTGTFSPGMGLSATWWTGKWYQLGAGGYFNLRDASDGQHVVLSGVLTFLRFAHVGLGYQLGSEKAQKPLLLVGLNTDLGLKKASD